MRSPANARRLLDAMERLEAGRGASRPARRRLDDAAGVGRERLGGLPRGRPRPGRVLKRINVLIEDISRNGNEGIGKPEALKHDFAGYWSRRITDEHRLVYKTRGPRDPHRCMPLSLRAVTLRHRA